MHQVIAKRNVGLSVFIFEMGIISTYIRDSETKEMCVAKDGGPTIQLLKPFWSQYFSPLLRTFPKPRVEYPDYHLHLF